MFALRRICHNGVSARNFAPLFHSRYFCAPSPEKAAEAFRKRAAPEIVNAIAAAGAGAVRNDSAPVVGPKLGQTLQTVAEEEVEASFGVSNKDASTEARIACAASLAKEGEEVSKLLTDLEAARIEKKILVKARADALAIGFQNPQAENQEFASLIVCATAGIFAVSIHYVFFGLFAVGYYVYRKSTRAVREQRQSAQDLSEILAELRKVEDQEKELVLVLNTRAEVWREGRTE
eukprot:TRINITY_DN4832_c0_g1_i1.p1 TRINITY_DN4832_c0_g1~~TRINITY_DN4832_c0_g1_i1.p1  ORF type:complete len:234 (-),score=52.52 TRINITY_DN4832_c0_g1_i1:197-898(-)